MRSFAGTYESFDRLTHDLLPKTEKAAMEDSDPNDPQKLDAIWSVILPAPHGALGCFSSPRRSRPIPSAGA